MIVSGGENIYPAELERILAASDDLAEYAVVGRPDEKWGETPVCIVVPKPGAAVTEASVLSMFDGRLARYKYPRAVMRYERPAAPDTARQGPQIRTARGAVGGPAGVVGRRRADPPAGLAGPSIRRFAATQDEGSW